MKNAQQVMAKPWKNKNHPWLIIWQVRVSHISILTVCKIHLKSHDSINELYDFLQFIFIKYQRKINKRNHPFKTDVGNFFWFLTPPPSVGIFYYYPLAIWQIFDHFSLKNSDVLNEWSQSWRDSGLYWT